MKQLKIPYSKNLSYASSIEEVMPLFEKLESNLLSNAPWAMQYPDHPLVNFKMAYAKDCLLLKYHVEETHIRAVNNQINGSVWQDSCVEFFVSWDDCKTYYNLEFNCIGTTLVGYRSSRDNKDALPEDLIKTIKFKTSIKNIAQMRHQANGMTEGGGFQWALALMIPYSLFKYHTIEPKKGTKCRANFYKCGDLLPNPHFISWSDIVFEKPNFHLPEFFGELIFS